MIIIGSGNDWCLMVPIHYLNKCLPAISHSWSPWNHFWNANIFILTEGHLSLSLNIKFCFYSTFYVLFHSRQTEKWTPLLRKPPSLLPYKASRWRLSSRPNSSITRSLISSTSPTTWTRTTNMSLRWSSQGSTDHNRRLRHQNLVSYQGIGQVNLIPFTGNTILVPYINIVA